MRPCHCCLLGMVSHQIVYVTMHRQKLKDAACHLKQLDPYTSWSNASEREIKELKKGVSCKLLRSRAPKHLWDDSLELEVYIRYNSAHELYKLDGKFPKTVMSGETSDISHFCELEWFKWVMFQDETVPFPDDVLKLGHYIGPSIDIDSVMTKKFLQRKDRCSTDQHRDN